MSSTLKAAVFEPREFDTPGQREAYRELTAELRCLVCQNQNIADSDAPLAADLRDQVYEMLRDGKSEHEVTEYLVARYGDFVRYKPPLNAGTVVLWISPFVLVLLALAILVRKIQSNRSEPAENLTPEEQDRLAALLGEAPSEQSPEDS